MPVYLVRWVCCPSSRPWGRDVIQVGGWAQVWSALPGDPSLSILAGLLFLEGRLSVVSGSTLRSSLRRGLPVISRYAPIQAGWRLQGVDALECVGSPFLQGGSLPHQRWSVSIGGVELLLSPGQGLGVGQCRLFIGLGLSQSQGLRRPGLSLGLG